MNEQKIDENKKEHLFYYECARCEYRTSIKNDMIRHLNKIKKCIITQNYDLTESEIYNKSTIKLYKNGIKETKINENNKIENNNNNSDKKEIKKNCEYCNSGFSNSYSLKRHVDKCKNNPKIIEESIKSLQKNLNTTVDIGEKKEINTMGSINNYEIVNNNIIQQNTQNNLIINLNVESINTSSTDKILVPFFDKFDTSHINDEVRMNLLLSNLFIETLREILKNSVNLNFIVKKEDKKGLIYKNEEENIVAIDNIIVYNNVWKKVRDYLLESLDKIKYKNPKPDEQLIELLLNKINKKYNDFILGKDNNYIKNVIGTIDLVSNENYEQTKENFKVLCNYQIEDV